jgi:phage gp16-like protein
MSDWRKSMLAKIHVAKKQLGLTDDEYRTIIEAQTGERSAAKLNNRQLDQLLTHFSARGWKERTVRARKGDKSVPSERDMGRKAMLGKIEALLAEIGTRENRHVPWDYAAAILQRMFNVDKLEWAKPVQLRAVIAALHRRAYGARPEDVVDSLMAIKLQGGDFEYFRELCLSQLGARNRAKAEKLLAGRLASSTAVQPEPAQLNA